VVVVVVIIWVYLTPVVLEEMAAEVLGALDMEVQERQALQTLAAVLAEAVSPTLTA